MRKQVQNVAGSGRRGPSCPTRPRLGFTIVELLVVVAIMALLVALLVPAIWNAISAASNAAWKMEVSQIAMALEKYKQEMGEYPPDFSVTGDTESDTITLKRQAINNHLARKYRLRNGNLAYQFSSGIATGGDSLTDQEIAMLNPTNALYFWLRGFSDDPQHPLTGLTGRDPYYDFGGNVASPSNDLLDNDRDGQTDEPDEEPQLNTIDTKPAIAVYSSSRDSFNRPLIYYRGVPTHPNLPNEDDDIKAAYDEAVDWVTKANAGVTGPSIAGLKQPVFPYPYWSSTLTRRIHPAKPAADDNLERERIDPEKFQLIAAGRDGKYGIGGDPRAASPNSAVDSGVYPDGSMTRDDVDNITNFGQASTLEDTQ